MARKTKLRKKFVVALKTTLVILFSLSGGVLFSFGLIEALKDGNNWYIPVVGGVIFFTAVFTGIFTTETAFALNRKKK